ncbi:MAG: pyridoxamine 5'-phosphate oxidase family protein [Patescibacteria group bacterium]
MNDQEQLNKFLSEQDYMTIAVTLDDGTPWVTPVRIKQWEGAAFEWMSKTDTEHSRAIAVRPQVALSMYTPGGDTTIQFGFYATATAELLSEQDGMGHYKASVTKSWINDATFVKREVSLNA